MGEYGPASCHERMLVALSKPINALSQQELEKEAKEIFGEDEATVAQQIGELQKFLTSQPHLAKARKDPGFLHYFLRGMNYDLEKTKEKLDYYFCVKTNLPAWFADWDPTKAKIKKILNAGIMIPLKGFDRHGRFAMLFRSCKIDPATMEVDDLYKVFLMVLTVSVEGNDQANSRGFVVIQDQAEVGASHMMMMTPSILKKHVAVFQDAFPTENPTLSEASCLYYTNMPRITERMFNMFLSFLNEKYKKMIKVLPKGDDTSLIEDVGKEIIPSDYGGTNDDTETITRFWAEEVMKHKDWLQEQTKYKSIEEKRPGKPKLDLFEDRCVLM